MRRAEGGYVTTRCRTQVGQHATHSSCKVDCLLALLCSDHRCHSDESLSTGLVACGPGLVRRVKARGKAVEYAEYLLNPVLNRASYVSIVV